MVRRRLIWCAAVVALLAGRGAAGDKEPSLEDYAKASLPVAEHKALEPLTGVWTYTAKCWMKPGDAPQEMSGVSARKWILGGRFLHDQIENTKPAADFQGLGLTGYDKAARKYTSMWVDSMSTAIQTSYGTVDKSGKVFTYHNEVNCPLLGKKVKGRDVIRILDQDHHVMEMYKELDGKEIKVMEITYARKK